MAYISRALCAFSLFLLVLFTSSLPLDEDRETFTPSRVRGGHLIRRVDEEQTIPLESQPPDNGGDKANDVNALPLAQNDDGQLSRAGRTIPVIDKSFKKFTAIGDSYSAGPGIAFVDPIFGKLINNEYAGKSASGSDCLRTHGGWPSQLKTALKMTDDQFEFSACTGLNTSDIRKEQVEAPGSKFGEPDLVTITMGGNDKNSFATVVTACPFWFGRFLKGGKNCDNALADAKALLAADAIVNDMTDLLDAVVQRVADKATIIVMGYPALYNKDTWSPGLGLNCWLTRSRRTDIDSLVDTLNHDVIRDKVIGKYPTNKNGKSYQILFGDPNAPPQGNDPTFNGHRFCETTASAYFQGTTAKDPRDWVSLETFYKGLFHPNNDGMKVMAMTAQRTLQGADKLPDNAAANNFAQQSEADFDRDCPIKQPDIDVSTALEGLTVGANHALDLGAADPSDPIDPMDGDPNAKRDLANHALNLRTSDSVIETRGLMTRAEDDNLVPIPSSLWWKFKYGNSAGYVVEGNGPTDAWTLCYTDTWTSISDLSVGLAPKTKIAKIKDKNGKESNGWQADHILEGQTISAFFNSDRPKYNKLLDALTKTYAHPNNPQDAEYGSFKNYGNCYMEQVATLVNGAGNIAPLVSALNGYKGGLFTGYYKEMKMNNDMKVAGVLGYMYQVEQMHHDTASAIGKVFDEVPDVGGKFGTDFFNFATKTWDDVVELLEGQNDKVKTVKPLLTSNPPAIEPFKAGPPGLGKRKKPF